MRRDAASTNWISPDGHVPYNVKTSLFTLIEFVVVFAVMILLMGFVFLNVGRIPTFITLEDCVSGIKKVFDEASTQSVVQGRLIMILYSVDGKTFYITEMVSSEDGTAAALQTSTTSDVKPQPAVQDFTGSNHLSYTLPESAKIEFPDDKKTAELEKEFFFYPDGTGSGLDMILTFKGHKVKLRMSRLTGVLTRIEIKDDDEK